MPLVLARIVRESVCRAGQRDASAWRLIAGLTLAFQPRINRAAEASQPAYAPDFDEEHHATANQHPTAPTNGDRPYTGRIAADLSAGAPMVASGDRPGNHQEAALMNAAPAREQQAAHSTCGGCSSTEIQWFTPPARSDDGVVFLCRCGRFTIRAGRSTRPK